MSNAKWTFMIYLAGDNSLSSAADKDLIEMRAVGSTPEVNVVTQLDNAGNRGTTRVLIQRDGAGERPESIGETDSGSPAVLSDFISWAAARYPADRYALVLWSHGSAWEPAELDRVAREAEARGYTSREANQRSASQLARAFFRSSLQRVFRLPTPAERAVCFDDGSGHSLDTIELGAVLERAAATLGRPIDLLGMDACLMSNIEVAYQARPFVRFLVASEELEPADGWPYDAVLRRLTAQPDLPTSELAAHIAEAYVRSYVDRQHAGPVTQAALDLSRLDHVVAPLDHLAEALLAVMPEAAGQIWNAQRKVARFHNSTLWDIRQLAEELARITGVGAVRLAAEEVLGATRAGADRCVLTMQSHGASVARCGGLSIYMPPLVAPSPFYGELAFAKEHRWAKLLKAYQA